MGADDDAVELEIWIAASPEVVFSFLTDPGRLVRWMGIAASVEPVPGGLLRINLNGRDVAPVVGIDTWELSSQGRRAEAVARAARPEEAVALALRLAARPGARPRQTATEE